MIRGQAGRGSYHAKRKPLQTAQKTRLNQHAVKTKLKALAPQLAFFPMKGGCEGWAGQKQYQSKLA